MSVQEFELFHGAVLTKILRNDRPVTMLIDVTSEEDRAYTIDDNEVKVLYVKHRTVSNLLGVTKKHPKGGRTWQFVFTPNNISTLRALREKHKNKHKIFLALVCGHVNVKKRMEICIVDLDKYNELLDLESITRQSIGVRHLPGLSFRILVANKEKHIISLKLIDDL